VSNQLSSPRIRPVTCRIPVAATWRASDATSPADSVGSPYPFEHEVPPPRRSALPAVAEHVRLDAEGRPERGQGRIRRRELLVRRRPERQAHLVREECLARVEIEYDRARLGRAHVRHAQGLSELLLEPVARSRLGGGREEEGGDRCG